MSNLPDAAYIRNLRNTGYRDGKDPTYQVCPLCEQTCETIYISADNEIVGCDQCMTTRNAWEVTECFGEREVHYEVLFHLQQQRHGLQGRLDGG